jgi:uncharacterized caspase-like protein
VGALRRLCAGACLALALGGTCAPLAAAPARGIAVRAVGPTAISARAALVIGNAKYAHAPLRNTANDARDVAAALTKLGFDVTLVEDATLEQMGASLRRFGDSLHGGTLGFFYYAGHGVQVDGHNYLVPVGVDLEREDEVRYKALDAEEVLAKMQSAGNPVNVVILDACRDNPFTARGRSLGGHGFASMDAPVGSIVAFSTQPGAQASDGAGRNGLYTQHLLKYLAEPGLRVEDVFKRVRLGVRTDSGGRQIPWESTSLEGDVYFAAPPDGAARPPAGPAPAADPAAERELALWDAVKDSTNPRDFALYLERYPKGRFASLAASRSQAKPAPRAGSRAFSFSAEDEKLEKEQAAQRDPWAGVARCPARAGTTMSIGVEARDPALASAAASALAKRLGDAGVVVQRTGARYRLEAAVATQQSFNRMIDLREMAVSTSLNLVDAGGRPVATALSRAEGYAPTAATQVDPDLLRQSVEDAGAQLYREFCARP